MIRNTEPHQKCRAAQPAVSGPSAEIAPPSADHSAIDFVRAGPDHSAVINASVVGIGHARRQTAKEASDDQARRPSGAHAASRHAGTDKTTPTTSIILRP